METWQKLLLAAGGAVGAAAVLYYLLQEEEESEAKDDSTEVAPTQAGGLSKEEVMEILEEMSGSQSTMTAQVDEISKAMAAAGGELPLDKLFEMVKAPEDPTEKLKARGLTMESVDREIGRYANDPQVGKLIEKLMGGGVDPSEASAPVAVPNDKIIEVLKCNAEATEKFVKDFTANFDANKEKYDAKAVMMAMQVFTSAKAKQKFDVADKDLQMAIMMKQAELAGNPEFLQAFQRQQGCMAGFMKSLGLSMDAMGMM